MNSDVLQLPRRAQRPSQTEPDTATHPPARPPTKTAAQPTPTGQSTTAGTVTTPRPLWGQGRQTRNTNHTATGPGDTSSH